MRKLLLLLPLIALQTACQDPIRREHCVRWMAAGKYGEVDAETRKALGLGENDDVEAYSQNYSLP